MNIQDVRTETKGNETKENILSTDEAIAVLAKRVLRQEREEKRDRKYAPVRTVLSIVAACGGIAFLFMTPKAAPVIRGLIGQENEWDEWKHFNASYLRRTLKRLEKQKLVTIEEKDGQKVVHITKLGRRRTLAYALDTIEIPRQKHWDRKWRIVIYDVPERQAGNRDTLRSHLRQLGFYLLQESVWLYPYPCEREVTFLKEYYAVGGKVLYVVAEKIEEDGPYRTYFGLS